MTLPKGKQEDLGPVPNATGFEAFTNSVLTTLLSLLYAGRAWGVYDEVFEILRKRGVFMSKDQVVNEPY